jgi:HSP20 family protein
VREANGKIVVRADLPGLNKDDIKVEITSALLTIQGERRQETKKAGKASYYSECSYGTFYRAIPLPEGVDPAKATAEFRNGVLEVAIPAPTRTEPKSRRVEVTECK